MVYENLVSLWKSRVSKWDMSEDQLRMLVEDLFDTYEAIGFTETFESAWPDCIQHNGKRFTVLRRLTESEVDLENLPMWHIVFEDGIKTDAFPEEICKAERDDRR